MRVLSMQGKAVWGILQRDGVYHADVTKRRERADYMEDTLALHGATPIWCFAYPEINYVTMFDGNIFEYLRCEMSLQQEGCWDDFLLFELDVMALRVGKHHNACGYSCVFPELTMDMVVAVYSVCDSKKNGWYYKKFTPIYIKKELYPLFLTTTDTYKEHEKGGGVSPEFTDEMTARCLQCKTMTSHTLDGKHFCSLKCAAKYKRKFIADWGVSGLDITKYEAMYSLLPESVMQDVKTWYISQFLSGAVNGACVSAAAEACAYHAHILREWSNHYGRISSQLCE